MGTQGAPTHYLAINATCLALGLALIAGVRVPKVQPDVAAVILAALLFLPLLAGPSINGVHRWIGSGPIAINVGLLALPALAVIAARMEPRWQIAIVTAALAAAVAQPDAALALAIGGAAIGIALATRESRASLAAIAALLAAIWAQKRGVLPPQPFVEQVFLDAAAVSPLWLALLVAAMVAAIVLIALDRAMPRSERYALTGAVSGFAYTAAISAYPAPLVGYGASAILGLALALWIARSPPSPRIGEDPASDQMSSG